MITSTTLSKNAFSYILPDATFQQHCLYV